MSSTTPSTFSHVELDDTGKSVAVTFTGLVCKLYSWRIKVPPFAGLRNPRNKHLSINDAPAPPFRVPRKSRDATTCFCVRR